MRSVVSIVAFGGFISGQNVGENAKEPVDRRLLDHQRWGETQHLTMRVLGQHAALEEFERKLAGRAGTFPELESEQQSSASNRR